MTPTPEEIARSVEDIVGACQCPEGYHHPDCVFCCVVNLIREARVEGARRMQQLASGRLCNTHYYAASLVVNGIKPEEVARDSNA